MTGRRRLGAGGQVDGGQGKGGLEAGNKRAGGLETGGQGPLVHAARGQGTRGHEEERIRKSGNRKTEI